MICTLPLTDRRTKTIGSGANPPRQPYLLHLGTCILSLNMVEYGWFHLHLCWWNPYNCPAPVCNPLANSPRCWTGMINLAQQGRIVILAFSKLQSDNQTWQWKMNENDQAEKTILSDRHIFCVCIASDETRRYSWFISTRNHPRWHCLQIGCPQKVNKISSRSKGETYWID